MNHLNDSVNVDNKNDFISGRLRNIFKAGNGLAQLVFTIFQMVLFLMCFVKLHLMNKLLDMGSDQ